MHKKTNQKSLKLPASRERDTPVAARKLAPVRSLSKSREVFERLRDAIWSGDLEPGVALRETHLAKELNVSQVPVREALLQLENLGLVVRIPDRGTTVTRLTRDEIVDMIQVRSHLESLAFSLSVKNLTPQHVKQLRLHLECMGRFVKERDHFAVAEEDFKFHRTVWRASGNEVLAGTLERLCIAFYAFVSLKRHAADESMKSAVKAHTKLLKALQSGDQEIARKAIQEHLTSGDVIPESIKN